MAKEKSITELKDEKKQLSTRSKTILETAKGEKRLLTTEENEELGANQVRMAEINLEIEEHEDMNRRQGRRHQPQGGKFSLRRAIANMVDGNQQNDVDAGVIDVATTLHNQSGAQMADKRSIVVPVNMENRAAFTAATEAATGVIIDEEQQEMLLPLQSALVCKATFTGRHSPVRMYFGKMKTQKLRMAPGNSLKVMCSNHYD